MRSLSRSHDRRMLPRLLQTLALRATNVTPRPLLRALAFLQQYVQRRMRTSPADEAVPLDGGVRGPWRAAGVETDLQGRPRMHRLPYAICVLQALREPLRGKERWVVGAERQRHPDAAVPTDFATQRPAYYAAVHLPPPPEECLRRVQHARRAARAALEHTLPRHPEVHLLEQAGGWLKRSPLAAPPEPPHLLALHAARAPRWPLTRRLDILQESARRVGFTPPFRSPTAWDTRDRDTLHSRLLVCLYGLGTHTGRKRMQLDQAGVS